jgi:hypothetical protein
MKKNIAEARCTAEKKAITDEMTSKCELSTKKHNKECKESLADQKTTLEKKRTESNTKLEAEH